MDADKTIFDLERQANLARIELSKLEKSNKELTQLSDKRTRELATLKASLASGGGSAKTALAAGGELSLSGPAARGGRARVNEVRDPGGSINQVLAENRERYAREDAAVMASAPRRQGTSGGMQVSAVAAAAPRNGRETQTAAAPAPAERPRQVQTAAATTGQTAVVKAGEGVAQVVYRVMGTRDPEVIAWVIRENKLKKDKRGNPMIYPEQKLQLPADGGRSVQSASAARR